MEYKKQLAANLGQEQGARILTFKQKAPAPPEGYENHMASLYTANAGARPKKAFRAVPQQPDRILDAPDLVDDYYLNLLDWGSKNAVSAGLPAAPGEGLAWFGLACGQPGCHQLSSGQPAHHGHGPLADTCPPLALLVQVAIALNQSVYLWNASSGDIQELLSCQGDDYVTSVSWAADGQHVAVGFSNSLTQIWDTERVKPIRNLQGHAARVSALSWNNHILSSGGRDSVILNHDVRVREHVTATLRGHDQEVCGLKWSPNGTQVGWVQGQDTAAKSVATGGWLHAVRVVLCPTGLQLLSSPPCVAARQRGQRQPADDLGPGPRPPDPPHHQPPGGCEGAGLVPLPVQPAGLGRWHRGQDHQVLEHPHRGSPQQHRHRQPGLRAAVEPPRARDPVFPRLQVGVAVAAGGCLLKQHIELRH